MVRSSRVDQPPVSGVPVAGATTNLVSNSISATDVSEFTSRIQSININTQIHRLLSPDPIPDFLDNAICANFVDLPSLNNLESTVAIILIVRWS